MVTPNDTRDTHVAGDEEALIQAHLAALAWIEAHLLEPMTVKSIADRANRCQTCTWRVCLSRDSRELPGAAEIVASARVPAGLSRITGLQHLRAASQR
jgi:hypothetical protein